MNDRAQLSDEEIVGIIRTKDKELYVEIIKRYEAKLLRYASYILGDVHAGADAVQEAFIKTYINLNGFDTNKKFSSWIYRIVHNEAMNILNKRKKQRPIDEWIDMDSGVNLEDEYIKRELISSAHNCLEKMPLLYKVALTLYYLEDKSYKEIGDILRIPIGTVGTRVNRAKIIMKKICQNQKK